MQNTLITYKDLSHVLLCVDCGSEKISFEASSPLQIVCEDCDRRYLIEEDILYFNPKIEAETTMAERQAALNTENNASVGGIGRDFSNLEEAEGELKEAILSLPFGNNSNLFDEEGYFRNVKSSSRSFNFLVEHLVLTNKTILLDLGADLTWSTNFFARKGVQCIATDINHHLKVSKLFRKHFQTNYLAMNCNMNLLSFRSNTFDIITAFSVLHHSSNIDKLAETLYRFLKPYGCIAFLEPFCGNQAQKEAFGKEQIEHGINENVYLIEEWHSAFQKAGFSLKTYLVNNTYNAIYEKKIPQIKAPYDTNFYNNEIRVISTEKRIVKAGETFDLPVQIKNFSKVPWVSEGPTPTYLSYHLYQKGFFRNRLISFDNPRTKIKDVCYPGHIETHNIRIKSPLDPGEYIIEFDLVREAVTWFKDKGSKTATVHFRVR